MALVGVLGVVRMDRVGIVAGDQKAVRHQAAAVAAAGGADALQGVRQEGGGGALLGLAADLLVVKEAVDRNAAAGNGGEEGGQGRKGALEVVEPGGGDQAAPLDTRLGVVEEQVGGENVGGLHPGRGCGMGAEGTLLEAGAVEGRHIHGGVVGCALVGLAVHVDGHVGDDGAGLPQVTEAALNAALRPDEKPSGDGEGAVHPAGAEHPAVGLRPELDIAVSGDFRRLLELEAGAVAVGGGHHEAGEVPVGQAEGDQGGAVAGDIVARTGPELPVFAFGQRLIAGLLQQGGSVGHGLIGGRAGCNIRKQCFVHRQNAPHSFGFRGKRRFFHHSTVPAALQPTGSGGKRLLSF